MKRSHSLWLAASALLATTQIATAQIFPYQDDLWQLRRNQGQLISGVSVMGTTAVKGFKFAVAARLDGALPLVQRLNSSVLDGNIIYICRRINSTTYAAYSYWDLSAVPASSTGGILLTPGDYLLVTQWSPSAYLLNTNLLAGRWVGTEHQADYWALRPGANALVNRLDIEGFPIQGIEFEIAQRGDGALPVITDMTGKVAHRITLWKRQSGSFYIYADWLAEHNSVGPEIVLEPGTYLLSSDDVTASFVRYLCVLSGFWAKPAPHPTNGPGR